jgi:lysophospholipase L1-like esterase
MTNLPFRTALVIAILAAATWLGRSFVNFDTIATLDRLWAFHTPRPRQAPPVELPIGKNFGKLDRPKGKSAPLKRLPGGVERIQGAELLSSFFEALRRVEAKEDGARVRIAHYGDSPTTADLITADARDLLQRQFGGAGHGYHLIAKPWAWYMHRGIDSTADGWDVEPATTAKTRDGLFGYGGVSVQGGAGATARFRWRKARHTTAALGYLRQPSGGALTVEACRETLGEVDTAGERGSAFATFSLPDGCEELRLRVARGRVRLFGLDLRDGEAGLIYDSLGINGAYISVLSKFLGEAHWSEQLQHYQPDLVVINYGTNESVYAAFVDKVFEKELRTAIQRAKAALPGKSILVMSPMDRGERAASGFIETVPALERLVAIEEKIAAEEGVAFFNTFRAMGGRGTMREWYEGTPRLVGADFIHPMPAGAKRIGEFLFRAVMDGFNRHKSQKTAGSLARNN